jgi:hypothetical protein
VAVPVERDRDRAVSEVARERLRVDAGGDEDRIASSGAILFVLIAALANHVLRRWHDGVVTTYEKTGALLAGSHLSGSATVATGIVLVVVGARMMTQQSTAPQPHYHSEHHHYGDVLGGALVFAIGAAVLRSTFKFHRS